MRDMIVKYFVTQSYECGMGFDSVSSTLSPANRLQAAGCSRQPAAGRLSPVR